MCFLVNRPIRGLASASIRFVTVHKPGECIILARSNNPNDFSQAKKTGRVSEFYNLFVGILAATPNEAIIPT